MSTLYISEFYGQGRDVENRIAPIAQMPPLAQQTVTIGGSSVQSSALQTQTGLIRLATDINCSISIGTNPTATTSTLRMAADSVEYFTVPPGASFKVAVITGA